MRCRRIVLAAVMSAAAMAGVVYSSDERQSPLEESYRLQQVGDYVGAQAAMQEAAAASPRAYFPRLRLAYLQLCCVDYAAAAESYRQAATLEPGAVEPLLGQQQALLAQEKWDLAEKTAKELLAKDAKNYLCLSRLAWGYKMKKDFRSAADTYAQLLKLYPGDAEMRTGLGYSLLGMGKKPEAAAVFREVLAMVPGHLDAMAGLAATK